MQRSGVRDVMGFDARDVDTFAAIESGAGITVAELADGAELHEGVATTGPGTPGEINHEAGPAGAFPIVLGVRSDGDQVALAGTQPVLDTWGSGATLEDDPDLSSVADVLDDLDVYTAVLQPGSRQCRPRRAGPSARGLDAGLHRGRPRTHLRRLSAHRHCGLRRRRPRDRAGQVAAVWNEGSSLRGSRPLSETSAVRALTTQDETVVVELTPSVPVSSSTRCCT